MCTWFTFSWTLQLQIVLRCDLILHTIGHRDGCKRLFISESTNIGTRNAAGMLDGAKICMAGAAGAQEVEDAIRLHCLVDSSEAKNAATRRLLADAAASERATAQYLHAS